MIEIAIDAKQVKRLREATAKARKSFGKQLAAAINDTTKKGRLEMGRNIRSVVKLTKPISEKEIKVKQRATEANLVGVVSLGKEARFGLQRFSARQTKAGVKYQISKIGGTKTVSGAFMGPKPGVLAPKLYGGVFKRVGKKRLPIVKLYGVSPFGTYVQNNFEPGDVLMMTKNLQHQMERRINQNVLRAAGLIKH